MSCKFTYQTQNNKNLHNKIFNVNSIDCLVLYKCFPSSIVAFHDIVDNTSALFNSMKAGSRDHLNASSEALHEDDTGTLSMFSQ